MAGVVGSAGRDRQALAGPQPARLRRDDRLRRPPAVLPRRLRSRRLPWPWLRALADGIAGAVAAPRRARGAGSRGATSNWPIPTCCPAQREQLRSARSCAPPRARRWRRCASGRGRTREQPRADPRDARRRPVRCRDRRRPRRDRRRAALRQLGTAEPVAGRAHAAGDPVRAAGIGDRRGLPAPRARRRTATPTASPRCAPKARRCASCSSCCKDGGVVGILPDQQPKAGDGEFAPFFGMPALTMTLLPRLAQRTGATVLFAYCERIGETPRRPGVRAAHRSRAGRDRRCRSDVGVAALNAAVERIARRDPAQYQWTYKRYSIPRARQHARQSLLAGLLPCDARSAPHCARRAMAIAVSEAATHRRLPIDADWQPLPPRARSAVRAAATRALGVLLAGMPDRGAARRSHSPIGSVVASIALPRLPCGVRARRSAIWRGHRALPLRRTLAPGRRRLRAAPRPHVASRNPRARLARAAPRPQARPARAPLEAGDAGDPHRRQQESAVSVSGLDADDAERLRDRLARQLDDDDAL